MCRSCGIKCIWYLKRMNLRFSQILDFSRRNFSCSRLREICSWQLAIIKQMRLKYHNICANVLRYPGNCVRALSDPLFGLKPNTEYIIPISRVLARANTLHVRPPRCTTYIIIIIMFVVRSDLRNAAQLLYYYYFGAVVCATCEARGIYTYTRKTILYVR